MIHKNNLTKKYVTYKDKNGAYRTEKVIKVSGSYLTVRHIRKIGNKIYKLPKTRIHKDKVIGRQLKNKLEPIDWSIKRNKD